VPFRSPFDPSEHHLGQRTERLPGAEEKRELSRSWRVAGGTLACPACDLPVYTGGPVSLGVALGCPYCDHTAPVREFLILGDSPRPARVKVTATIGRSSAVSANVGPDLASENRE